MSEMTHLLLTLTDPATGLNAYAEVDVDPRVDDAHDWPHNIERHLMPAAGAAWQVLREQLLDKAAVHG